MLSAGPINCCAGHCSVPAKRWVRLLFRIAQRLPCTRGSWWSSLSCGDDVGAISRVVVGGLHHARMHAGAYLGLQHGVAGAADQAYPSYIRLMWVIHCQPGCRSAVYGRPSQRGDGRQCICDTVLGGLLGASFLLYR